MVHRVPGLVREVPEGDRTQVTILADHVEWMVTFLLTHHEREDRLVRLLERLPTKIDPLNYTTGAQHHGLAQALDDLGAKAVDWRASCAVRERDPVAGAATEVLGRISEHLDLEERKVPALIDSYLTELVGL